MSWELFEIEKKGAINMYWELQSEEDDRFEIKRNMDGQRNIYTYLSNISDKLEKKINEDLIIYRYEVINMDGTVGDKAYYLKTKTGLVYGLDIRNSCDLSCFCISEFSESEHSIEAIGQWFLECLQEINELRLLLIAQTIQMTVL